LKSKQEIYSLLLTIGMLALFIHNIYINALTLIVNRIVLLATLWRVYNWILERHILWQENCMIYVSNVCRLSKTMRSKWLKYLAYKSYQLSTWYSKFNKTLYCLTTYQTSKIRKLLIESSCLMYVYKWVLTLK
jgi:hypothetical protein